MSEKPRKRRLRLHEVTAENDIKYRGPLNYQHFQILGWLCIVVTQAVLLLRIGGKLNPDLAARMQSAMPVLEDIGQMSLPLLLIANFAQILDSRDGYKKQLLKNLGAALGIFVAFTVFFNRYFIDVLASLTVNPAESRPSVDAIFRSLFPQGFFSFNLFIDLLMCTLVMIFLNYRPKRIFVGKLRFIFRLFALLPIAYEITCMVLKVQASKGLVSLPSWSYPLLTVKPPMTFVLFIILAVFIKTREMIFRRHGKTHEEYQEFLKTNRNSRNFSIFLAVAMILVSVADFVIFTGYSAYSTVWDLKQAGFLTEADVERLENEIYAEEGQPAETAEAAATAAQPAETAETAATAAQPAETAQPTAAAAQATPTAQPAEYAVQAATQTAETVKTAVQAAIQTSETVLMNTREKQQLMTDLLVATIGMEMKTAIALGFGGSIYLALLAPLVLLFSYTRIPKNPKAGLLIPAGGIALILFLYLEAFRYYAGHLPIPKIDTKAIKESLELVANGIKE